MYAWPATARESEAEQRRLAGLEPEPWQPGSDPHAVGGCFVCFARGAYGPGAAGDPAVAAAVLVRDAAVVARVVARGSAGAPYLPGLLALREGPLLESAVHGLPRLPDVLLVDATGRDHPRHAGLALQLGAAIGVPTVGVTHRPLLAEGAWPDDRRGARAPLLLDRKLVGYWLRTRPGTRPLAVHAAWRTDPELAAETVLSCTGETRTPAPLREARRVAREERARSSWEAADETTAG